MESTENYYKKNIDAGTERLGKLKKSIHLMGTIRLLLVIGAICSVWFYRNENWQWLTCILLMYAIPFFLLMWRHNIMYSRKLYVERWIRLNLDELKALEYDFSAFDGATDKITGEHPFSLDLDLFGQRSLFQSINRTVTTFGRETLINWFTQPLNNKKNIIGRQNAIKELSTLPDFRQDFHVNGSIRSEKEERTGNNPQAISGMPKKAYSYFYDKNIWKVLIWIVPIGWIGLGCAYALDLISGSILNLYFLIILVIAYSQTKKINRLYASVNKMENILKRYAKLLSIIETQTFHAEELIQIQSSLKNKQETASDAIKRLSGYIGGLDQRYSLAGIIFNILYLRDIRHTIALERWIQAYADKSQLWFDALAHIDALCSLGSFAFNHPEYVYPEIADHYFQMKGKALGHPLINRKVCVKNDINITHNPSFLIITGANMAGKSTYLRTVGINYLLACVGAPVCADSLTVYPASMVTSLRTSDSLASNESYFFAELKRLRMIIERLQKGEQLFIILDEILKGTNSIDKQKGSLALMKQLVNYRTCGIIATHDLVLGSLEDEFPGEIRNFRFEADIKDNELSFSYRLREGVAQNMNACFLMKKMGIIIEE